jgi:hypothetical protein
LKKRAWSFAAQQAAPSWLQTATMLARGTRASHRTPSKTSEQFDSHALRRHPSHLQYATAYDGLQHAGPQPQLARIMVDCAAQSLIPS